MLVLDTSAAVAAVAQEPPNPRIIERLATDGDLRAPHLIDVEFVHALRGLVRRRQIGQERAAQAMADFGDLRIVRYAHVHLRDRIWELRDNLTAYDAAFVALAEVLNVPLVTTDGALARVSTHLARVEVL